MAACGSTAPSSQDARGDAGGDKGPPAVDAPVEAQVVDAAGPEAADGASNADDASVTPDGGDARSDEVAADGSSEARSDAADGTSGDGDAGEAGGCTQDKPRCAAEVFAICMNNAWVPQRFCRGSSFCENDQCIDPCSPTTTRCGLAGVETCGADRRWHATETCALGCKEVGFTAQCTCTPSDTSCTTNEDPNARSCGTAGLWTKATSCLVCKAGKCQGVCRPNNVQCATKDRQTCDAEGQWQTTACDTACNDGVCGTCFKGAHRCGAQQLRDVCSASVAWAADGSCVSRLVSGKGDISCGIKADGSFSCWGNFSHPSSPHIETQVSKVRLLAAGNIHECAVALDDNRLLCSGWNGYGQQNIPAGLDGSTITQLVAGAHHTCALKNDGQLVCWGDNGGGRSTPPPLPTGVTYTHVSTSYDDTCAVRSDGAMVCFGTEDSGQFQVPPLPANTRYVRGAAGFPFACALRSDNVIACWGDNSKGQLNAPAAPTGVTYTDVCAGQYFGCALRSDGAISCWGAIIASPKLPAGEKFVALNCGSSSGSGVMTDGTYKWWNQSEEYSNPW
jgi:hypothetical protein